MHSAVRLVIALFGLLSIGITMAADDPIAERRQIMQKAARAERAANNIILGKFLPEKATKTLVQIQELLTAFPALFPVGSETGGETKVSRAVWIEMEEFLAMAATTVTDAKAAEAAIADGQDAFSVAWQVVADDCTNCHAKFTEGMMIR